VAQKFQNRKNANQAKTLGNIVKDVKFQRPFYIALDPLWLAQLPEELWSNCCKKFSDCAPSKDST
jgi:hypothetical protein